LENQSRVQKRFSKNGKNSCWKIVRWLFSFDKTVLVNYVFVYLLGNALRAFTPAVIGGVALLNNFSCCFLFCSHSAVISSARALSTVLTAVFGVVLVVRIICSAIFRKTVIF
jgi:hypothetical protein